MRAFFALLLCLPGAVYADSTCDITASGADIAIVSRIEGRGQPQSDYGMLQVSCSPDTAWSLEVLNAGPGGVVDLQGALGGSIPAALSIADTGQAFGRLVDGNEVRGVGNGNTEAISIRATVEHAVIPRADTYQTRLILNLSF